MVWVHPLFAYLLWPFSKNIAAYSLKTHKAIALPAKVAEQFW